MPLQMSDVLAVEQLRAEKEQLQLQLQQAQHQQHQPVESETMLVLQQQLQQLQQMAIAMQQQMYLGKGKLHIGLQQQQQAEQPLGLLSLPLGASSTSRDQHANRNSTSAVRQAGVKPSVGPTTQPSRSSAQAAAVSAGGQEGSAEENIRGNEGGRSSSSAAQQFLKQVQQLKQQFQVIHTVLEQQKGLVAGGSGSSSAHAPTVDAIPPAAAGAWAGVATDQQQQHSAGRQDAAKAGAGACTSPTNRQLDERGAISDGDRGIWGASVADADCSRRWLGEGGAGLTGGGGWLPWEDPQLMLEAPWGGAGVEAELLLGALPMQQLREAMLGGAGDAGFGDRAIGGLGVNGCFRKPKTAAAAADQEAGHGVRDNELAKGAWEGLSGADRGGWLAREGGLAAMGRGRGGEGLLEARLRQAYRHMLQQLHTRWQQEKQQLQLSYKQVREDIGLF